MYGDGGPTIPNPNWPATIVTWWGILSDFNSSDMTAAAYPGIYNEAVAAMLAVDKTIQISALEFGDNASNTPGDYLPDFLAPPSSAASTPTSTRSPFTCTRPIDKERQTSPSFRPCPPWPRT